MAYGNPAVSIQWEPPFSLTFVSVNSNTVQENGLFYAISNLTIYKVSLNNSGIYRCLAINNAGNNSVAIHVIIEGNFNDFKLFISSQKV